MSTTTSWSDSYETKVSGGTTENTAYYFVNNELIAKKNPDGSRYFFHNDHLGSTTIISNQSGTLVEETKYDPWGVVTVGGTKSKFLYTGQEHDGETGLDYYNFRYYDSSLRRFVQPDDIIQDVYNPQSLNRYSYVWNNPLKYTDPTGHAVDDEVRPVIPYFEEIAEDFDSGNYGQFAWKAADFVPLVGAEKILVFGGIKATSTLGKVLSKQIIKQSVKIAESPVGKQVIGSTKIIAGKITGYTKHGINQAIGRDGGIGVSLEAIRDSVKNPTQVIKQVEGKIKYVGEKAVVVLNKFGEVVSTWSKGKDGRRK